MGVIQSVIRDVKLLVHTIRSLNSSLNALLSRINSDPGIPLGNPTFSYWQADPHTISATQSETLPQESDIVIIGSGITACSIARNLLLGYGNAKNTPRIVILEARKTCSGATGRNGGHIKEAPQAEWTHLKATYGSEAASKIIKFRLNHLDELLRVAKEEDAVEFSEIRKVTTVDYLWNKEAFNRAKEALEDWLSHLTPEQREEELRLREWKVWDTEEAREKFQIPTLVGAISFISGAVSPYNLITTIFSNLQRKFPNSLQIETETPCTSIASNGTHSIVSTPRGEIRCKRVIHATNGHISHLLPGFRSKIFPVRGTMSAQTLTPHPHHADPKTTSLSFVWPKGFEYITLRDREKPVWMIGGGLVESEGEGAIEFGVNDDTTIDMHVEAYIRGILPAVYGAKAEALAIWSGIMAWSADLLPWVGRVPEEVTRRKGTTEYVCGAYSGEGMVNAWGSGAWLAKMILEEEGISVDARGGLDLPEHYLFSTKRWKNADIRNLSALF